MSDIDRVPFVAPPVVCVGSEKGSLDHTANMSADCQLLHKGCLAPAEGEIRFCRDKKCEQTKCSATTLNLLFNMATRRGKSSLLVVEGRNRVKKWMNSWVIKQHIELVLPFRHLYLTTLRWTASWNDISSCPTSCGIWSPEEKCQWEKSTAVLGDTPNKICHTQMLNNVVCSTIQDTWNNLYYCLHYHK